MSPYVSPVEHHDRAEIMQLGQWLMVQEGEDEPPLTR